MMKRALPVLAILMLLFTIVGCDEPPTSTSVDTVKANQSAEETSTGSTEPSQQSSVPVDTSALPPHTVASDTDISVGSLSRRRIEIHVTDPDLSKDDAVRLIEAYRGRAREQGQVSMRKPDSDDVLQPWAVDNMEGKGVEFNDELFVALPKDPPLKPAPGKKDTLALKHYNARDKYLTADLMTAWTRKKVEAALKKDGGKKAKEVWPGGRDLRWVEVKYRFPDDSWLFISFSDNSDNQDASTGAWQMGDIFPPFEAR